jgi:hypothetical protein
MKAATLEDSDHVAPHSLSRMLANIGAENRLSSSEIEVIFKELGNGTQIPAQNMVKIL